MTLSAANASNQRLHCTCPKQEFGNLWVCVSGLKICEGRNSVIWHLIGMGTAPAIHSIQFQDHTLEVSRGSSRMTPLEPDPDQNNHITVTVNSASPESVQQHLPSSEQQHDSGSFPVLFLFVYQFEPQKCVSNLSQ